MSARSRSRPMHERQPGSCDISCDTGINSLSRIKRVHYINQGAISLTRRVLWSDAAAFIRGSVWLYEVPLGRGYRGGFCALDARSAS